MSKTGWPSRTGIGSPSGDPKNLTAKSANCSFGVALNWRQQGTGRQSDCLKRSGRLPTSHLTLNPTLGTRPDRPERNASRALRVQLARVKSGHSPPSQIRPGSTDRGSVSDSQADSAGSIPVTRSTHEKRCRSWGFVKSFSPISVGLGPLQSTVDDP